VEALEVNRLVDLVFARVNLTRVRMLVLNLVLVLAGAGYVVFLSKVALPLPGTPVMISLGTFSVLSVGAILGSKRGAAAVGTFALSGAVGLPVFQGPATLGYVFGYIGAAYITGRLAERFHSNHNVFKTAAAFALGLVPVYFFGTVYLMMFLGITDLSVGISKAVAPFLLAEVVKVLASAVIFPSMHKIIEDKEKKWQKQ
jgi:biotin transport system substrate-specific component